MRATTRICGTSIYKRTVIFSFLPWKSDPMSWWWKLTPSIDKRNVTANNKVSWSNSRLSANNISNRLYFRSEVNQFLPEMFRIKTRTDIDERAKSESCVFACNNAVTLFVLRIFCGAFFKKKIWPFVISNYECLKNFIIRPAMRLEKQENSVLQLYLQNISIISLIIIP